MTRRSRPSRRVASLLAAMGLVAAHLAVPAGARAADPLDPDGVLAERVVDVALVETGRDAAPELLTLDQNTDNGDVRIRLLRRTDHWQLAQQAVVAMATSPDETPAPWLVDLGRGGFAVIAASQRSTSLILGLTVASETATFKVGHTSIVDLPIDSAGAADVDGDGSKELVLESRDKAECAGTVWTVMEPGDPFVVRSTWPTPYLPVAGAAFGEFDGLPGTDLVAVGVQECLVEDGIGRDRLEVMRLGHGSTIHSLSTSRSGTDPWPVTPLVTDVDGDGRDEILVRLGGGMVLVDPVKSFEERSLGSDGTIPLAVVGERGGGGLTRIVALEPHDPDRASLTVTYVSRGIDGSFDPGTADEWLVGGVSAEVLGRTRERLVDAGNRERAMPVERIDLAGDGCEDILAPGLRMRCQAPGSVDAGPDWLATRPLRSYSTASGRAVLVALGLIEWEYDSGTLLDPSPAATYPDGAWRNGPSGSFALAEIAEAAVVGSPPTPAPVIDRDVSSAGDLHIGGSPNARIVASAIAVAPGTLAADPIDSVAEILSAGNDGSRQVAIWIDGPLRAAPAVDGLAEPPPSTQLHVTDINAEDGSMATDWLVSAASLDEVGDLGGPVRAVVNYDIKAPDVTLEAPFVTFPWPFAATITGRTEPGAKVRIGDTDPVVADVDGRFEIHPVLAPWPQAVEVTTSDRHGNQTTSRISVMGGLDVRQVPWLPILTVGIISGAAVASFRGRQPGPRPIGSSATLATAGPDDPEAPVIEELPPGTGRWPD